MAERSQITEHEHGAEIRRSRLTGGVEPASTHDRVLDLQRSAGNAAVSARIGEQAAARTPSGAPLEAVPAAGGAVQRAGFFSKIWQKVKGFFSGKPKTGKPVESATTEGPTTPPPELTGETGPETSSSESTETPATSEGPQESTETSGPEGPQESTETPTTSEGPQESTGSTGPETPTEETKPAETGPIAPETTKTEPEHPSPPPLAMDLASGETVLKNAFGSMKTIVPGKIEILAPPAFKEAYDKIYGSGQWSWDRYVVPTYGSLNGFAFDGVNYINTGSAGLHTVVHEMLHNNCASDWIPVVGSRFNEGTTEILTQVACAKLSVDAPTCYPGESPCVQALLDAGLPLADLEAAYLNGGAQAKVADWVDANCKENWAAAKGYMEAKNWDAAKAALAKKT